MDGHLQSTLTTRQAKHKLKSKLNTLILYQFLNTLFRAANLKQYYKIYSAEPRLVKFNVLNLPSEKYFYFLFKKKNNKRDT